MKGDSFMTHYDKIYIGTILPTSIQTSKGGSFAVQLDPILSKLFSKPQGNITSQIIFFLGPNNSCKNIIKTLLAKMC